MADGDVVKLHLRLVSDTPTAKSIAIEVKTLTGRTYGLIVKNTDRWSDLAYAIYEQEGIPPDQQRLQIGARQYWNGGLEEDDDTQDLTLQDVCQSASTRILHLLTDVLERCR